MIYVLVKSDEILYIWPEDSVHLYKPEEIIYKGTYWKCFMKKATYNYKKNK